jgi:hypothetical protein
MHPGNKSLSLSLKQATRALTSHWARASACCPYTARGHPQANPKRFVLMLMKKDTFPVPKYMNLIYVI